MNRASFTVVNCIPHAARASAIQKEEGEAFWTSPQVETGVRFELTRLSELVGWRRALLGLAELLVSCLKPLGHPVG